MVRFQLAGVMQHNRPVSTGLPGDFHLPDSIIRLENVHLTLGEGASRVHVLNGASLNVSRGESVAVLGPSGSGKSTLLMVMAGLERADSGMVKVGDSELTGLSEDMLASFRGRNVGIVFQSFHLIANMTALENVAVPLELAGDRDAFDKAAHGIDGGRAWRAREPLSRPTVRR